MMEIAKFYKNDRIGLPKDPMAIDWVPAISEPISLVVRNGKMCIKPYETGDVFVGLLASKGTHINDSLLFAEPVKENYTYTALAKEALANGDYVKVAQGGFIKCPQSESMGRVIDNDEGLGEGMPVNILFKSQASGGGGGGYTLPTASQTIKGGIKVGDNLETNGTEFLSVPVATSQGELGVIAVDGTSIKVDENGVISSLGEAYVLRMELLSVTTSTPSAQIEEWIGGLDGMDAIYKTLLAKGKIVFGYGTGREENFQIAPLSIDALQTSLSFTVIEGAYMLNASITHDGTEFVCGNASRQLVAQPENFQAKIESTSPDIVGIKDFYIGGTSGYRLISFSMETIVSSSYVKGSFLELYRGDGLDPEMFGHTEGNVIMIPVFHAANPFYSNRPFFSGVVMLQYHSFGDYQIGMFLDYSNTDSWNMFLTGIVPNPYIT